MIADSLSWLVALHCRLNLPQPEAVEFSSKLRELDIELTQFVVDPASTRVNTIISTVSTLLELRSLRLSVPWFAPMLNLSPLAAIAQLSRFTLTVDTDNREPPLMLLDQIRCGLPHLRQIAIANMKRELFLHLLRSPHHLQWEEMQQEFSDVDDALAGALCTLRNLTCLEAWRCSSVDFLPSLTRLQTLDLRVLSRPVWAVSADAIVKGLSRSVEITDLTLSAPVNSSHMQRLLACLPLLRALRMDRCSELESLGFFSECPATQSSLRTLSIFSCQHPSLALIELPLSSLTSLTISQSFAMDAATIAYHSPPSVAMPSLTHFAYRMEGMYHANGAAHCGRGEA